jgi:hypothetical protein
MPNKFEALGMTLTIMVFAFVAVAFAPPLNSKFFWGNATGYFLMQLFPAIFAGALVVKHLVMRHYWSWVAAGLAVAAVFVLRAIDERYLYKGANSMPYFVYIFFCAPLALFGIYLGAFIGDRWLNTSAISKACLVFFSGTLFGVGLSGKALYFGLLSALSH